MMMKNNSATTGAAAASRPAATSSAPETATQPAQIESWADESFPINSRQASEIIADPSLNIAPAAASTPVPVPVPKAHTRLPSSGACTSRSSNAEEMTVQHSSTQGESMQVTSSSSQIAALTTSPTSTNPNQSFGSAAVLVVKTGSAVGVSTLEECQEPTPSASSTDARSPAAVSPALAPLELVVPAKPQLHIRRMYRHDPYCIYTGIKLLQVCTCEACVPTTAETTEILQAVESAPWNFQQHQQMPESDGEVVATGCYLEDAMAYMEEGLSTENACYQQQQQQLPGAFTSYPSVPKASSAIYPAASKNPSSSNAAMMDTDFTYADKIFGAADMSAVVSVDAESFTPYSGRLPPALQAIHASKYGLPQETRYVPLEPMGPCSSGTEVTSFIPPAPPLVPKIQPVLEAEDTAPVDKTASILQNMMNRWYTKVYDRQADHLKESEFCPAPEGFDSDLTAWSIACNLWWNSKFGKKQIKEKPQSSKKKNSAAKKKAKKAKKAKEAAAAAAAPANSTQKSHNNKGGSSTKKKPVPVAEASSSSSSDDEDDE